MLNFEFCLSVALINSLKKLCLVCVVWYHEIKFVVFVRQEMAYGIWQEKTRIVLLLTRITSFHIYRMSQEECARLREGVPYFKVYRYNSKHICPKLNGYGDNGQRKVWSSGGSTHCTCQLTSLIDVCPWVWCPMTESPLTLAYSRLIPECAVSHVTSVLAFICHV